MRDNFDEIVKDMACGYQPSGDWSRLNVTNFDTVGATSLLTTVEDLARWNKILCATHGRGRACAPDAGARKTERRIAGSGMQLFVSRLANIAA